MIQLQVLNYILEYKDYSIIELNNIGVEYFNNYKDEFNYIKQHYLMYNTVCDKVTFMSVFPNFELITVTEPPQFLLKELLDDYNTRLLVESFNKVRKLIVEDGDIDKALNEYKKTQERLVSGAVVESVDIIRDKSRYNDYVERTRDFNKYFIPTGWKEIDKYLGGFDRSEELALIVARTNKGKSWVLLYCAMSAVMQGLNVGLYSGEMSPRKVGYRFDTMFSHFNNNYLTHGNISIQNEYKQYIDDLPNKVKGSLKVITPSMISGPATVSALKAFIKKEKLDILFVDQVSLLEDQRGARTTTEQTANISKDLKNLQVIEGIPVVVVSQLNRQKNDDGSVDTTQIAQSDRLGQDATLIIFVEKNDDLMKLTIGKARDSEVGKVFSYHIDLNLGTFQYIPEDNESTDTSDSDEVEKRYTDDVYTGGEEEF